MTEFGSQLLRAAHEAGEGWELELGDPVAEALRLAAKERLLSGIAATEGLAAAAAGVEVGALHAVGTGYALRLGEREVQEPAPLDDALATELEASERPEIEARALARSLSMPSPQGPSAPLLAGFAPGPEVWHRLEEWIVRVGSSAARQRLRVALDAAGVRGSFGLEPALARIPFGGSFRFGYAFAACESYLR